MANTRIVAITIESDEVAGDVTNFPILIKRGNLPDEIVDPGDGALTEPAGKFAEALDKLINELGRTNNKIKETSAITECRSLHERGHFPGLGYVKKLSMKHHIETLAAYFEENRPAS